MKQKNNIIFTIKEKNQETHNVVTLKMISGEGIPKYNSGQYITIYFKDSGVAEGKAYTISSEPTEDTLNITVKGIGEFSNRLCNMEVGNKIEASFPYGYFYTESETSTRIMIAGGIGVAPFRSMIIESLNKYPNRKIVLFYSNKTMNDIIFLDELSKLKKTSDNFIMKTYITKESGNENDIKYERISIGDIEEVTKDMDEKEYFLCGSIAFVRDFWRGLKNAGIKEESIFTEAFF